MTSDLTKSGQSNKQPAVRRISVRHSTRQDIEAIKNIYSGRHAIAGTLQLPFPSEAVWEERLAKSPAGVYSLVAETDALVLGHTALSVNQNPRRHHAGTIGMAVSDDHVGMGVGTALLQAVLDMADNWLNLARVELTVFTDNTKAIKLYEKCGFVVEGEAAKFAFRDGEYVNAFYMGRVK